MGGESRLRDIALGRSDAKGSALRDKVKNKDQLVTELVQHNKLLRDKARGHLSDGDDVPLRKKAKGNSVDSWFHDDVADRYTHFDISPVNNQQLSPQNSRDPPLQKEDNQKVDPVIALVKEFLVDYDIAVVGGALYKYNGSFYELLPDRIAQALILRRFEQTPGITSLLGSIVKILKIYTDKDYDEFPMNPNIIVFKNGTLELNTMAFRSNSPKDMASSALAINYNGLRQQMPHINQYLRTATGGNGTLRERILQAIGYICTNDISAKSFIYLQGVGDSGKSLLCALIAMLFPETGANAVGRVALQDFGGKFALASLVNARLNVSEDLPDIILTPATVSKIKMLSDFNRVECEQKYVPAFSYRFLCKLLFASNHPLRLKEYDQAFVNRIVYIPFEYAIPKELQDRHLLQKMLPELPALFNYAIEAYKRLVENGYNWAGNFEPEIIVPKSPAAPSKALVIQRFISNCCTFDSEATTSSEELKFAYDQYCHENGHQAIAGDRFSREFLAVLPNTVERVKIGNQRRGYKGIKLKQLI